jgi:hypothetical protein
MGVSESGIKKILDEEWRDIVHYIITDGLMSLPA